MAETNFVVGSTYVPTTSITIAGNAVDFPGGYYYLYHPTPALSLVDQMAHTFASPPVAYLLFTIGMALLLFELFTAGVGIAGMVGAVARGIGESAAELEPEQRRDLRGRRGSETRSVVGSTAHRGS